MSTVPKVIEQLLAITCSLQYTLIKRTGSVPSNLSLLQQILSITEGFACNLPSCPLISFSLMIILPYTNVTWPGYTIYDFHGAPLIGTRYVLMDIAVQLMQDHCRYILKCCECGYLCAKFWSKSSLTSWSKGSCKILWIGSARWCDGCVG